MTVVSTDSRKSYAGNGVTTSFATTPVVFFDSTELAVYVVTTATGVVVATLVENTDYTVTGGAGTTGTINTAAGSVPYGAPAAGTTLLIVRELDLTQESDFVNNDPSDAEVAEDALDRLTMMLQQLNTQIERSFVLPTTDVSGASTEIPTPVAASLIGWDDTGTALQNYTTSDLDLALTTAFTLTLLDDATAAQARTTLDAQQATSSLTEDLAPDKTADFVPTYDTSASAAKKVKIQQLPLPRAYLAGLGLTNNAGDATNDIDFAVGEARDSTNAVNLVAATAMTKQLDAAWAAGTAAGGRMSAAAIANTTYFCYAIRKDTDGTVDFGFDTSATAPTMPTGYTFFRRIAPIIRLGGTILPFTQDGDKFVFTGGPVADISAANPGTAAVTRTLTLPVGLRVEAIVSAGVSSTTATTNGVAFRLSDLSTGDVSATNLNSQVAATFAGVGNAAFGNSECRVFTNTSAQVRSRASFSDANVTVFIGTAGWVDRRGRDA